MRVIERLGDELTFRNLAVGIERDAEQAGFEIIFAVLRADDEPAFVVFAQVDPRTFFRLAGGEQLEFEIFRDKE